MPVTFEADVALIHISGGSSRSTPPPGSLAQSAPRRAARGRSEDLLFLNFSLLPDRSAVPGLTTHLAQLGAEVYYGTPGSVTAGLRELVTTVNDRIADANQSDTLGTQLLGQLVVGVLRGSDFYIAQCGIGHSILIRHDLTSLHSSEQASNRPLGISSIPYIRYHHIQVQPGDFVILTTSEPPVWAEPVLEKLSGLDPVRIIERLSMDITREVTGMVVGIAAPGAAVDSPVSKPASANGESTLRYDGSPPKEEPLIDTAPVSQRPSRIRLFLRRQRSRMRRFFSWIRYSLARIFARLTPGLAEPPPGSYSPKVLMATAIIVPILVVFIASIVYFQRGRAQQYQLNLADARVAISAATGTQDEQEAKEFWLVARFWLDEAAKYGTSEEYELLYEKVSIALDDLERIRRLEFQPVVSGGFGPEAEITALAATSTELYVLDSKTGNLWHLWATGQGYDIDGDFECLDGVTGVGKPVDLAIEPAPSALRAESILAIDAAGNLVYCAPDEIPVSSRLTMPDLGWGRITSFDVYNNQLYVMDTELDAVWVYDSSDGLVSGRPTFYFVSQIPDLADAIDMAASQIGLLILYADGRVDQCQRGSDTDEGNADQGGTDCSPLIFRDERAGYGESETIPNTEPIELIHSPPPDSSLLFLDGESGGVYRYSLNLIYQGQYQPDAPFEDGLTAFALGPPNSIFIATGNQVHHALINR